MRASLPSIRHASHALWLALVALLVVTTGCSNDTVDDTDVNQDKLYGRYQAHFDDGEKSLHFFAQLRLGGPSGTTIRLTDPGSLEVYGQTMRLRDGDEAWLNLNGTYYALDASADAAEAKYTFTWNRNDGQSFVNDVAMPEAFAIGSPAAGSAHGGGDLVVTLSGPTLEVGEDYWVTVTAEADAGEGQRQSISESITAGVDVVFPADEVAELPAGELVIEARRGKRSPVQAGHDEEGGELWATWRAADVRITYTP